MCVCINSWGTIFFVCSKLEILFRKNLCKCSQCWTKICYVPYPLQSCESGTGYNIMWFEKSLYFSYYFAIFSVQLYMYIFKKIAPILSPIFLLEVTSSPEFGTLCWHQSGIDPVLEIAHSKLNFSCLWTTIKIKSIPFFKKLLEVDILFYILHSEITTLLHWVSLLNRLCIQVFNQTWYKPLSFSDGN